MKKLAAILGGVAALVILATAAKPPIINAGDYLVRQPLLALRDEVSSNRQELLSLASRDDLVALEGQVATIAGELSDIKSQIAMNSVEPPATEAAEPIRSSWVLVTDDAPFHPRDGAAVASFNGYIWLTNGYNPEPIPNPIYRSRDGETWEIALDAAPWPRRHLGGFVVLNDRLFMIAGDFQTDVWSSSDGINWRQEPDVPWGKRYNPYIGVYDGKIWMMGGQTFDGPDGEWCEKPYCLSHAWNDVWSTEDGKTWELVTERAAWEPRALISGFVVHDGAMWIMGGGIREIIPFHPNGPTADTRYEYADVWRSTDGKTWESVTFNAEWPARTHLSVMGFDGFIILNDGSVETQGNLRSGTWASTDGETWVQIGDHGQFPSRHASSLVEHNGDLFLIAGLLHNDVWRLDRTVLQASR